MFPRLTHTYGGDPMRWMAELPMVIVKAYHRMLGPLAAEDSILAVQRFALGMGAYPQEAALNILAGWRSLADLPITDQRPARVYPTESELTDMGFKVFAPKPKAVPA